MAFSAQQLFRELAEDKWRPFYAVVGDEPFQASEIVSHLKQYFVKNEADLPFNYEAFDGEHLDGAALAASLNTLPGLFGGEDARRLVVCSRFDKASASALDALDGYFRDPSPSTCFLILCVKADKRKSWYKRVEEKGAVIDVAEPYEREWPKWHGYFEKRSGKRISAPAWERLVEASGRSLSLLWSELTKAVIFVGDAPEITPEDLKELASSSSGADVFDFAEQVLLGHSFEAMSLFQALLKEGENEIKLLSILVRQFRLVSHYIELKGKGVQRSQEIASELGVHPFFVSKIQVQARKQTPAQLIRALALLAESDFRLKTGAGGLFEHFLVPYLTDLSQGKPSPSTG